MYGAEKSTLVLCEDNFQRFVIKEWKKQDELLISVGNMEENPCQFRFPSNSIKTCGG